MGVVEALARKMDACSRAMATGRARALDQAVLEYVAAVDLLSAHRSYEAAATLLIDDAPAGTLTVPFAMHIMSSTGPSVGADHGSAVSDRYQGANDFDGTFERLDVRLLGRPDPAAESRAEQSRQ